MVLVSLLISSEKKIVYETLAQQIETRVEVVSVMDWRWIAFVALVGSNN